MRLFKWFIGTVIVLLVLMGVTPLAAKWYLVHQLEKQGVEADIKRLGVDFIFREITVDSAVLKSRDGAQLSLFNALIELNWRSIFAETLELNRVTVEQLSVDLSRNADQWQVLGSDLDQWAEFWSGRALQIGLLQLNNTQLCRFEREQCLRLESLTASRMQVSPGPAWVLEHRAPLRIHKVFLQSPRGDSALLYVGDLQIGQGKWATGQVGLQNVALENGQFVESASGDDGAEAFWQTQLGELQVDRLAFASGESASIDIGKVNIISLRQALRNVQRVKDNPLPDALRFWAPSVLRLWDQWQVSGNGAVALSLEAFELRDGALSYTDDGVQPPVAETFSQVQFSLEGADSRAASDLHPVRFSAKFAENGLLKFDGQVAPFALHREFELSGLLQNVNLANVAGYSQQWLGQPVLAGILDVGFDLKVQEGALRGETLWRFTDVQLEATAKRDAMPLEAALKLLEDHNQSVPLELTLRGNVEDGALNPRRVLAMLSTALKRKAQQKVSGTGVTLSGGADGAATLRFRPLTYRANSRVPEESDQARLDEIVALLLEKPHFTARLCPFSTGGEWADVFNDGRLPGAEVEIPEAHREELLDLARARGKTLRSMLVDQGVGNEQISICKPRLDLQQSGASYITVSL